MIRKKVLIADDSAYFRNELNKILQDLGYEVVSEASTGAAVVSEFINSSPDVVILDIIFPDRNGLDILAKIKALKSDAKVIICSASYNEAFVKRALFDGAMAYLTKPVDKKLLQRELEAL